MKGDPKELRPDFCCHRPEPCDRPKAQYGFLPFWRAIPIPRYVSFLKDPDHRLGDIPQRNP